jgi:hypothetical protein
MNRSRWQTWIRAAVGVAVFAVLVAWAWALVVMPPPAAPRSAGTILSAASDRVLRASCFDCHSNEPRYEWFDYLPVAATLVAYDVMEGRQDLNLSEWDRMSARRLAKKLKEMKEQIEEGDMPPWYYTPLHPDARMSPDAQKQLLADLSAAASATGAAPETEEREHEGKRKDKR